MPELPEVEIMRRFFEVAALDKKIESLDFLDELDKVFHSSRDELTSKLKGNHFEGTERYGKYLFAKINSEAWLHLHFGMTGNLELFQGDNLPKYSRFIINFSDGTRLAFCDLRKFGVIQIVESPETYRIENKIGRDLLKVSSDEFATGIRGRKIAIKTALLDQKHFAGIGNWIADEVLFDCGIHPQRVCSDLSEQEINGLLASSKRIIEIAIEKDTHYGDFPKAFFVNYRKKGALHPEHPDSPVEALKVGGRGTFIVPEKQKLSK